MGRLVKTTDNSSGRFLEFTYDALGKRLTRTVVAVPYATLTTVQNNRPVLPHNSIWGQHYNAMGATRTQTRILLQM